jgi:hypothetical protein
MCRTDPYRREGGTVSERVEKLVEKVVVLHEGKLVIRWPKLGFWSFFGAAGRDVTAEEFEFVKSAVRAALLEARREALKEAAELGGAWTGDSADPNANAHYEGFWDGRAQFKHQLLGLAGEERTK